MAITPAPRNVDRGQGPLRQRVARGTIVNAVFLAVVNLLGIFRGVVVAVFLTATAYGQWGIVSLALGTLLVFRQVGTADRYVWQDAPDQQLAFQQAMTLEAVYAGVLLLVAAVMFPVVAVAYGEPSLVAPGLVLSLTIPALALQSSLSVHYRRLDFRRQRTLQALDPVTAFVVTLSLAAAGLGFWSLVIGTVAGAWASAIMALRAAPYPFLWRFDRSQARAYVSFSWPMLVGGLSGTAMGHMALLGAQATIGLAAVGVISLNHTLSLYANKVDQLVTSSLYPALCAVNDRLDLLQETFLKSNRLAVLWGFPFGLGLTVFADPFVRHVLGREWLDLIPLLQATGIVAAVHQIGFNWDAFYRAQGNTRPLAWSGLIGFLSFCVAPFPLLLLYGLEGFAVGFLIMEALTFVARWVFIRRLFPDLRFIRHAIGAAVPTVPAVAVVLLGRLVLGGDRSPARAIAEVVVFCSVITAVTFIRERPLLGEITGYLRRPKVA